MRVLLYKSNNNTESENIHQKLTDMTQIIHMHMHILKKLLKSDGTANKNSLVVLMKHHFVLITPFHVRLFLRNNHLSIVGKGACNYKSK